MVEGDRAKSQCLPYFEVLVFVFKEQKRALQGLQNKEGVRAFQSHFKIFKTLFVQIWITVAVSLGEESSQVSQRGSRTSDG